MVNLRRLALCLAIMALLGILRSTAPGTAADDPGRESVRRFGSCLAAGAQGRLLLLMDTSASLRTTDPDDQRVEAAAYLVSELTKFVEQSNAELEVAVSGFSDKFDVSLPWTKLDATSSKRIRSAVTDYRDKDNGFETDYWTAVTGARRYLSSRAHAGDCSALVWLSDGSYDLDKRDTAKERDRYGTTKPYGPDVELVDRKAERQLERAGRADLCRSGGVADAVRVDGITTLAIGLKGDLDAADFDLMKGIATSSDVDGKPCGARDGTNLGAFVLAGDVASLFFAFDEIVDPDHAPISTESKFCQGTICSEHDHRFVLDPSISSVRILGGSELKDYFVVLISPSGKQLRIVPTRRFKGDYGAFSVRGTWRTDSVFSISIQRESDKGWTGVWRMVFVDPNSTDQGTARSNIRLFGDLEPAWTNSDLPLVIGEKPRLQLGLQRQDGTPVDPASIAGSVALNAELESSDGTRVPFAKNLQADDLASPVELDLTSVASGPAKVRLNLRLTTAAAGDTPGTTLEPQAVEYSVTVQPPSSYPTVAGTLDFGNGEDTDPVTASLKVSGDGCVWLADAQTLTLPEGVKKAAVSSEASSDADCAARRLTLTLTPSDVGSGLVSGTLQVMTKPVEGSGAPVPETVNYRYEMERPADPAKLWGVFVGLLVLGVLIPLLLLLVVKWVTAKVPGPALSWLTVAGSVGHGSSFLNQVIPDLSTIRTTSLEGADRRRITLTSRATLRAKPHLRSLSAPGHVVVDGAPALTSVGPTLPLAVQDHWIAVLDPSNPGGGAVEVTFLLAPGAAALTTLMSDARANLPDAVERLRQAHGATSRTARKDSEWDLPTGQVDPTSGGHNDQW